MSMNTEFRHVNLAFSLLLGATRTILAVIVPCLTTSSALAPSVRDIAYHDCYRSVFNVTVWILNSED